MDSEGDYETTPTPFSDYKETERINNENLNKTNKINNSLNKKQLYMIIPMFLIFLFKLVYSLLVSIFLLINKPRLLGFYYKTNLCKVEIIIFDLILVISNLIKLIIILFFSCHTSMKKDVLDKIMKCIFLLVNIFYLAYCVISFLSFFDAKFLNVFMNIFSIVNLILIIPYSFANNYFFVYITLYKIKTPNGSISPLK